MSHYSREDLLRIIKRVRDELMTPMNSFERSKWVAETGYMLTGILTVDEMESEKAKVAHKGMMKK